MQLIKVGVIVGGIVAIQWLMRKRSLEQVVASARRWWLTGLVTAAMLFAVITTQGSGECLHLLPVLGGIDDAGPRTG